MELKKSNFKVVSKTLLALTAGLVVLTISLTTATMAPLSEGFEAGGKTAYAAGNVTLGTGSWFMNEALTGNLSTDRKTGVYSARIRETGLMHMNFNKTGAGTVSIQHAVFGSDGSSTWQLWSSTNNGSSWTQVGSTVTTSSTSLQTVNFTVNNAPAITSLNPTSHTAGAAFALTAVGTSFFTGARILSDGVPRTTTASSSIRAKPHS